MTRGYQKCFNPSRDVFFSGDIAGGGHEQPPKVSGQPWNPQDVHPPQIAGMLIHFHTKNDETCGRLKAVFWEVLKKQAHNIWSTRVKLVVHVHPLMMPSFHSGDQGLQH